MARRFPLWERSRFSWKSPRPSSGSTQSAAHSLGSRRRPPTRTARRARSAHPRPRNRAPGCPARRSRRDSAVAPRTVSTAVGRLCRGPGRLRRSSTGRRTRHRTPIAKSQRSEIDRHVSFAITKQAASAAISSRLQLIAETRTRLVRFAFYANPWFKISFLKIWKYFAREYGKCIVYFR